MSVGLSFMLDVAVLGLLSATIYVCLKLNHHIQVIRDGKSEMATLIEQFSEATRKAQESIFELKASSKKLSEMLESRISKANFVVDDLSFMIEKAEKLTDNLESSISPRRQEPAKKNETATSRVTKGAEVLSKATISPASEKAATQPKTEQKTRTAAEKELMEALKSIR